MNNRVAAAGLLCLLAACSVPTIPAGRSALPVDSPAAPAAGNTLEPIAPRTDSGRDPGRDLGRDPGRDLGRDPGRDLGRDPGRDLILEIDRDSDRGPGRDSVATRRDIAAPAPRQYSPTEMFMAEHGDFMLNREGWRPDVEARFFAMSDAELKNEAGDFNLAYGKLRIDHKFYLDPNTYLSTGADYSERHYSFSSGAVGAHDNTLYRATGALGAGHFLDAAGSMLVEANFRPGVYTDFNGTLHHGDWQFFADGLLTWRYAQDIFLKVGVEYSGLFRDIDVYPLAGVTWLIEKDTWRVDVLLPRQARLSYQAGASTAFHLSLDLDGEEYRIRHPQNSGGVRRKINVQEMELSLGIDHRFDNRFSFHGRLGTTLLGDYSWRDNTANRYDGTLEPQLFAEVGFGWTF